MTDFLKLFYDLHIDSLAKMTPTKNNYSQKIKTP